MTGRLICCRILEREPINEEALPRLERDFIFPLRTVRHENFLKRFYPWNWHKNCIFFQKNPRFAAAVYFCRLCNCHINTLKYAETHMTTNSHIRAKEVRRPFFVGCQT